MTSQNSVIKQVRIEIEKSKVTSVIKQVRIEIEKSKVTRKNVNKRIVQIKWWSS